MHFVIENWKEKRTAFCGNCQNAYSLECLTAIYDQVAKPLSCTDEFAYDHPYQAKTDIYFHICKNKGHGGGQNNFKSSSFLPPPSVRISFSFSWLISPKPVYRFRIDPKIATDIPANNDGPLTGTQPYNEKGCQGRLRKAVQHYQIRLQYFCKSGASPQQNGNAKTQDYYEEETKKSFFQGGANVDEQRVVLGHLHKGFRRSWRGC